MGKLYKAAINQIIANLANEGKRIATEALRTKETKNRTLNQADAFGYAVYYNKTLKEKGYANPTRQAERTHPGYGSVPTGYGRDWLDEWIREYKPEKDGFVLVVVNAAYYTKFLEGGNNAAQRKYQVISQIYGDMESLAWQNNGSVSII